jgi:hypothetical protein
MSRDRPHIHPIRNHAYYLYAAIHAARGNRAQNQWSIYLVDLDNGTLDTPPVVGSFTGPRGEFYHQEQWAGRTILVRYVWLDLGAKSARMEQSFSPDGGKTWEVNWICELSR